VADLEYVIASQLKHLNFGVFGVRNGVDETIEGRDLVLLLVSSAIWGHSGVS
jgi:hypothetical protein